jgi:hypothetical protein
VRAQQSEPSQMSLRGDRETWRKLGISTFIVVRYDVAETFYQEVGLNLAREILQEVCTFTSSSTELKFLPILRSPTHYLMYRPSLIDGLNTLIPTWVARGITPPAKDVEVFSTPSVVTKEDWFPQRKHWRKYVPIQLTFDDFANLTSPQYTKDNIGKAKESKVMSRSAVLAGPGPVDREKMAETSDTFLQLMFENVENVYDNADWMTMSRRGRLIWHAP